LWIIYLKKGRIVIYKMLFSVVAAVGLALAGLPVVTPPAVATPVPESKPKFTDAYLYGEGVASKNRPAPVGGFNLERIEWKLGAADGSKPKPLGNLKKDIVPVCKTVILKKGEDTWVLLGPKGKDIELSLKKGPLADAKPETLGSTAFSYSPDGKMLAFVNAAGDFCRISLDKMELTVGDLKDLNWYHGIEFSEDGKRIAYERNDVIFTADADGKGEVKLVETKELVGFSFLPEGRVGVVSKNGMTTYDAKTGKELQATKWKSPLNTSGYPALSPDGSALVFVEGGPYLLSLYHFDIKTEKVTQIRKQYWESFQRPVWVKVPAK
jgi:hypothetical protein